MKQTYKYSWDMIKKNEEDWKIMMDAEIKFLTGKRETGSTTNEKWE